MPGTLIAHNNGVNMHSPTVPAVSVVIPTFNRASFLQRAVDSVLAQSFSDLECIVVDDGSTDQTRPLLQRLLGQDRRVVVITQENKGVAAARNKGIARSSGRWLALLDSDDCWLPEKLEKQLRFMQKENWEVCQTEEIWMRKGRRVNPMRKHAKRSGAFFAQALELCLVSPSCSMFSRGFWNKVGPFDESLRACEDYDFWLRGLLTCEIGLLPEALTIRHGGRSDQLSAQMLGQDLFRIKSLCKLLTRPLTPEQREQVTAVLQRKTEIYCQGCLKRGRLEEMYRVQELVRRVLTQPRRKRA